MTHIIDKNYTPVAARAILNRFLNADKSAIPCGKLKIAGSLVVVTISTEKKCVGFDQGWTVEIESKSWSPAEVREILTEALDTIL